MRAIRLPKLPDANNLYGDIVQWITANVPPSTQSLVVGVSGGIDSAVVASLCAGTVFQVYLYFLPSSLNSNKDLRLAGRVAADHGLDLAVINLQSEIKAAEKNHPGLSPYDRGNMISRIRANALWTEAARHNGVVVGTGNKDEDYGLGYCTLLGDGAVAMNPIGFLSKRLVREFAVAPCNDVDPEIVNRAPAAGLERNQTDFTDLGYRYEFAELVLEGLDQGFAVDEIVKSTQIIVEWTETNVEWARLKRRPKFAGRLEAVMDVLSRHTRALRKAALLHPKVPDIRLEYDTEILIVE